MSFRGIVWFERGEVRRFWSEINDIKEKRESEAESVILFVLLMFVVISFNLGWYQGFFVLWAAKISTQALLYKNFFRPLDGGTDWEAIDRALKDSEPDTDRREPWL